jgi:TRAP-type transport system small permease protein
LPETGGAVRYLKKIGLLIDSIFVNAGLLALLSLVVIVTMQLFTRKLFNFVFFWSEEVTLLLLGWLAFMGIALGFRENILHPHGTNHE